MSLSPDEMQTEPQLPGVTAHEDVGKLSPPMKEAAEGSYYYDLVQNDILYLMLPMLRERGFFLRWDDNKITADYKPIIHAPWHYVRTPWNYECFTWFDVMFNVVSQRTNKRFVPSRCQQCWKVVARPKTLKQLFAVLEIQMYVLEQYDCKCGVEVRPHVFGNYGGYWYNPSLQRGLDCYQDVRQAINEHEDLGENVQVILKRSCTEFELACGPSYTWKVTAAQRRVEDLVNRWFHIDPKHRPMGENVIHHVHRKWIEHAYSIGDPTYAEYTGGVPMYHQLVTYHHLVGRPEDVKQFNADWERWCREEEEGHGKSAADAASSESREGDPERSEEDLHGEPGLGGGLVSGGPGGLEPNAGRVGEVPQDEGHESGDLRDG